MSSSPHRASGSRREGIAFSAGMITAAIVFSMIIAFLVLRLGPSTVARKIGLKFTALVLDLPDRLIDELRSGGGWSTMHSTPPVQRNTTPSSFSRIRSSSTS